MMEEPLPSKARNLTGIPVPFLEAADRVPPQEAVLISVGFFFASGFLLYIHALSVAISWVPFLYT